MKDLESRITAIEERNRKVELDKKWETSWTRRLSVAILTYAVVFVYLLIIDNDKPAINALVPAVGFLLSTLLMRRVRDAWQRNQR